MQLHTLLALAVLTVPAASSSTSALNSARLWLNSHAGAPNVDELAELKGVNPEAYAIVKALLAKRSLGLLDPKHPSASFSKAPQQEESVEEGPEAFAKFASPGELHKHDQEEEAPVAKAAVPYAEVKPAAHRDWLNWKPQDSAAADESMVQNVLGAVAELKGKKAGLLSQRRNAEESTLANDEASFGAEAEPAPVAAKPQPSSLEDDSAPAVAAPIAAPKEKKGSGYLDFDVMTAVHEEDAAPAAQEATPAAQEAAPAVQEQETAPAAQEAAPAPSAHDDLKENSYLKGLDLTSDAEDTPATPEASTQEAATPEAATPPRQSLLKVKSSSDATPNYLASFSWNDEPQDDPKPVVQEAPKPKRRMLKVDSPKGAELLNWLGVVKKAPAPEVEAPAQPEKNPYTLDLSD